MIRGFSFTLGLVGALAGVLAGCGGSVATTTGDLDRFCELAREFEEDEPLEATALDGGSSSSANDLEPIQEQVMTFFSRPAFRERMIEFEEAAPDDIAPAVEFIGVGTRMAAVGDFTRIQSGEQAQAQALLGEYLAQHCGMQPPPDR